MRFPPLSPAARHRWPLALLLVSIGLTGIAVVEAQRAIRQRRYFIETALREMASLAAWSYQQHLRDTLSVVTREALGAVNHGSDRHNSRRIPDAGELPHYLAYNERCECHRARYGPNPRYFIGFRLGSDTIAVATNGSDDPTSG